MKYFLFIIALAFGVSASATVYKGPSRQVGNGRAYAWIEVDHARQPVAVGVSLTPGALSGLPTHMKEYTLRLPGHLAPYDHVGLDWNPMGHEPDHVYDKPHFDFHFYWISKSKRHRISCQGWDLARCQKLPHADYQPEDFVLTPGGVPRMGAHWIDPYADEFNGGLFDVTFIHGSYNGHMIFMEPMVTRDFLLSKPDFMTYVKNSRQVERSGYYPIHYRVKYDPMTKLYSIALVDLRYRDAH